MIIHTSPTDDLYPHKLIGFDCWCHPLVIDDEVGYGTRVVHNSADEREKFETGERKPS